MDCGYNSRPVARYRLGSVLGAPFDSSEQRFRLDQERKQKGAGVEWVSKRQPDLGYRPVRRPRREASDGLISIASSIRSEPFDREALMDYAEVHGISQIMNPGSDRRVTAWLVDDRLARYACARAGQTSENALRRWFVTPPPKANIGFSAMLINGRQSGCASRRSVTNASSGRPVVSVRGKSYLLSFARASPAPYQSDVVARRHVQTTTLRCRADELDRTPDEGSDTSMVTAARLQRVHSLILVAER